MSLPSGAVVKNLSAMQETQETQVQSLGQEDPLEEGMVTHCRILAWRISMDRGAWWVTVQGVTKSWTRLKGLSMHTHGHLSATDGEVEEAVTSEDSGFEWNLEKGSGLTPGCLGAAGEKADEDR